MIRDRLTAGAFVDKKTMAQTLSPRQKVTVTVGFPVVGISAAQPAVTAPNVPVPNADTDTQPGFYCGFDTQQV